MQDVGSQSLGTWPWHAHLLLDTAEILFGGVKVSCFGREGREGIDWYTMTKYDNMMLSKVDRRRTSNALLRGDETIMATTTFTAILEREGDGSVALCPELDVASQGDTEEALKNLREATELFLECAERKEIEGRFHYGAPSNS